MTHTESFGQQGNDETQRNSESQDSQAIREALRLEFAIPSSRSYQNSPIPDQEPNHGNCDVRERIGRVSFASEKPLQARDANVLAEVQQKPRPKATNDDKVSSTNRKESSLNEPLQLSRTREPGPSVVAGTPPNIIDTHAPRHDATQLVTESDNRDKVPLGTIALPPKMDVSQHTPTQVNEDRDYGDFPDTLPASHENEDPSHIVEQTLQADDTGAVNFGNLTQFGGPSSQVSEDGGFENTRGEWRLPDETPRHVSSHENSAYPLHAPPPETPAVPKNPFGAKPSIAAPFAGSQLFGQTQLSSAVKRISPTSSRPSPNLFHNTISPHMMETSPLKDRVNVSSPTDLRTSSPSRLNELPSTVLRDTHMDVIHEETPSNERSTEENLLEETPTHRPPKSSGIYQPMTHYEPMNKSQERKSKLHAPSPSPESDSDSDGPIKQMERRKRVQDKKARAMQEMGKVSFTRLRRGDSAEEPGSKRRRISRDRIETDEAPQPAELAEAEALGPSLTSSDGRKSGVLKDGSGFVVFKATPIKDDLMTDSTQQDMNLEGVDEGGSGDEEVIPATSPVQSSSVVDRSEAPAASEPDLPHLVREDSTPKPGPRVEIEISSNPPTQRRSLRTYGKRMQRLRKDVALESPGTNAVPVQLGQKASHPLPVESSPVKKNLVAEEKAQPPPKASQTRSGKRRVAEASRQDEPKRPNAAQTRTVIDITEPSSELSSAPSLHPSCMTTPRTQGSPSSEKTASTAGPSPGGTSLRKQLLRSATEPESPQPGARAVRKSRRSMRLESESTDELQWSPHASDLEKSTLQLPPMRTLKQSLSLARTGEGIFEGMVFAVSLQSNHPKQPERADLEAKIQQAGGQVLQDGFRELFEHSAILKTTEPVAEEGGSLKLLKTSGHTGFTALIADTHSRKPKYMQALALGLPCLAQQWIIACLSKRRILDWEPYLLCAGSSAVLGNAIRSRNLVPYSAVDVKLADVIAQRTRLLHDQRVLVVVDSKKGRSEAKEPYIFLAQALGPSMSRVFTVQQARDALTAAETTGQRFDWLYIDKGTGTAEAVFANPETKNKKRRRVSAAPKAIHPRVLDDELVIQSLILGKMIEDEEVNF